MKAPMQLPEKGSPIYPIIRVALRSGMLLLGLFLFYDRLDPRDAKTLLWCVLTDIGLTGLGILKTDKTS